MLLFYEPKLKNYEIETLSRHKKVVPFMCGRMDHLRSLPEVVT